MLHFNPTHQINTAAYEVTDLFATAYLACHAQNLIQFEHLFRWAAVFVCQHVCVTRRAKRLDVDGPLQSEK